MPKQRNTLPDCTNDEPELDEPVPEGEEGGDEPETDGPAGQQTTS